MEDATIIGIAVSNATQATAALTAARDVAPPSIVLAGDRIDEVDLEGSSQTRAYFEALPALSSTRFAATKDGSTLAVTHNMADALPTGSVPPGTYPIKYTAVDGDGLTATSSLILTVVDTVGPTIRPTTAEPITLYINATTSTVTSGLLGATVTGADPSYATVITNALDGTSVSVADATDHAFGYGDYDVTYTATANPEVAVTQPVYVRYAKSTTRSRCTGRLADIQVVIGTTSLMPPASTARTGSRTTTDTSALESRSSPGVYGAPNAIAKSRAGPTLQYMDAIRTRKRKTIERQVTLATPSFAAVITGATTRTVKADQSDLDVAGLFSVEGRYGATQDPDATITMNRAQSKAILAHTLTRGRPAAVLALFAQGETVSLPLSFEVRSTKYGVPVVDTVSATVQVELPSAPTSPRNRTRWRTMAATRSPTAMVVSYGGVGVVVEGIPTQARLTDLSHLGSADRAHTIKYRATDPFGRKATLTASVAITVSRPAFDAYAHDDGTQITMYSDTTIAELEALIAPPTSGAGVTVGTSTDWNDLKEALRRNQSGTFTITFTRNVACSRTSAPSWSTWSIRPCPNSPTRRMHMCRVAPASARLTWPRTSSCSGATRTGPSTNSRSATWESRL